MTDEELVALSKKGDEKATDTLFNKYKPLIKSKVKTYYLIGGDKDDVYQEGLIGFYKALIDYSGGMNVPFGAFANICITRRMQNAVKFANRKKHSPLNNYLSMDDEENANQLVTNDVFDPQQIFINSEKYEALKSDIDNILSGFEKQVFLFYIKDMSYADIAKATGKTQKSIDNAVQRIKRKLSLKINNEPR